MEILITIAYIIIIRLIFVKYKLLKFTLLLKFVVCGIWCTALLTEIIMLGQFAPYTKDAFVQAYVVQMAPVYGGLVKEVYARANVPVKKGEALFQMDPAPWQSKVDEYTAQLAAAKTSVAELAQQLEQADAKVAQLAGSLKIEQVKYQQIEKAAAAKAVALLQVEMAKETIVELEAELRGAKAARQSAQLALDSAVGDNPTAVAEAMARLDKARYNLEHVTIRAPAEGYVTNLQLHPGSFVRIKTPVMTFVSSELYWVAAKTLQNGIQRIAPGDHAELAFAMYPGKVFDGVVESIAWASGNAQGVPSGRLPTEEEIEPPGDFVVRLGRTGHNQEYPLRFGASASAVIYTETCPAFLKIVRQIEIQSESFLNYIFNPF